MHLQQMAQVSREQQEDKHDRAGEDDADEPFGKYAECDDGSDAPASQQRGLFGLPAVEEKVKRNADPESDGDVGDQDTSKEIRPDGSEKDYSRPKARLRR